MIEPSSVTSLQSRRIAELEATLRCEASCPLCSKDEQGFSVRCALHLKLWLAQVNADDSGQLFQEAEAELAILRRRIAKLEAGNKSFRTAMGSYSHEREMNADVACALKQRDEARQELAEERARLDAMAGLLSVTHGDTEDEWRIQWKTPALHIWIRDGRLDALRAAIDAARKEEA